MGLRLVIIKASPNSLREHDSGLTVQAIELSDRCCVGMHCSHTVKSIDRHVYLFQSLMGPVLRH